MTGDKRWYDPLTSQLWRRVIFLAFCFAPLLMGIASRIQRGSHWFSDYEAVACAGERAKAGLDIYAWPVNCEGMLPSGYVYTPFVAEGFGAGSSLVGAQAFYFIYLAVFALSFALLVWIAFFRKETPGDFWDRAPAFALITGSTIYWANIALPQQALICAAALVAHRRPAIFALALAAAAALKPVYLVYGLVLLVLPIPIWRRLALGAVAAGLGLAPTLHFVLTGGAEVEGWQRALEHFVYDVQPGDGFYGWLFALGLDGRGAVTAAGWVAYAAVLSLATIAIAACAGLSAQARVWLGVGMAALVNPRLSPNDVILLAVGVGAVIAAARAGEADGRARRWIVGLAGVGVCIAGLGNSLDAADYAVKVFTLMLSGVAIWLGWRMWRKGPQMLATDLGKSAPASA